MPGPLGGINDSGVISGKRKGRGRARKGRLRRAEEILSGDGFSSIGKEDAEEDKAEDAGSRDITFGNSQCEDYSSGSKPENNGNEVSRKRMKVSVTPEAPLRRSARRLASSSVISDPSVDFSSNSIKKEKGSPEKKELIQAKDNVMILPPNSNDLELEDLAVLDVFSVYSFLRSFSNQLFLSPFTLKAFVTALKSTIADSLIDAVHFSVLQALKLHLESLSEEGSEFASNCLRNLNWELVDLTNWPLYVAEYLLIGDPKMCSGLKLLNGEYYNQPATSKLEILRRLCDDILEVEIIRKEINKRMLELEKNVDTGQNPTFILKGNVDLMEMSDGNSDWCCLCGMDGNLICCDGCPAAFHSRCVGIAGNLLPEGEWYCPECTLGTFNGNMKIFRSLEGAEVLGFDNCSRIYFACCGYLLVSEPTDSNLLPHYYNFSEVHDVVKLLKSSCSSHAHLASSIARHWAVNQMNVQKMAFKSTIPAEGLEVTGEHLRDSSFGSIIASGTAKNVKLFHPIQEKIEGTCSGGNKLQGLMQENKDECSDLEQKSNGIIPSLLQEFTDYVNWYSFGRFTSSVAESMKKSPMDIAKMSTLTADDIISFQLRAIYKNSLHQYWSAVQRLPSNSQKDTCGWCFACRNSNEQECLLRVIETKILAGSRNRAQNFQPKYSRKSHLLYLVHLMLQIEDSLHGLLSGPWQNPHHRKWWRRNVLKAVDISSLKYPILSLESHLRRVALSLDWMKPLDSTLTVGSGSYILPRPMPIYPRQGGGKKTTRKNYSESKKNPDLEFYYLSSFRSKTDAYWWRGGRLSRQVFSWNMLPRSLASKGGRQAGCKRIPGVLYLEGSEFARRSKYLAWRAAVEMSQNAAQLMYQIKDLDSNIRWNDLTISHPLPKLGKDYRKSSKPTWKAVICQKRVDEGQLRYLLHFGKKKSIPDIVTKHGVLEEGTSNEDKKYWLDESYIPINILKAYEAKKLDKKLKKTNTEGVPDKGLSEKCYVRKSMQKKGLSYLLSRGKDSDQLLCRHCGKLVVQREEAVTCQLCKGPIHKKHFRLPKGASSTTYICLKCHKTRSTANNKHPRLPELKKGKVKNIMKKYKKILHDRKITDAVDGSSKRCSLRRIREKIADKELAGDSKERKLKPRHKKGGKKLVKRKILVLRKSERLAKKKKKLSKKIKKKKSRLKKGNDKLQKEIGQQVVLPKVLKKLIKWHKGQRTSIQPPFWLNGLMWTRKTFDDRAIHFKERSVLLPSRGLDTNIKPVCQLCHQEYDSRVIYIGCEYCGDWFHGDAFALNLGNINNVRGFKCHRCRTQTVPMCPYINGTDKV